MKIGDVYYYAKHYGHRFLATLTGKLLISFSIGFMIGYYMGR